MRESARDSELLVFLKAPRVGEVKTRLAATIGAVLATEVYRGLTQAVLVATAPDGFPLFVRKVCYAPADAGPEIAAWLGEEELEAQSGGDLGARLDEAFQNSFTRGATKTVIIGTDSLSINRAAVMAAFDSLESADVVLRAADDGGYTLIGLKRRHPALFQGIPWSTDAVLRESVARATALGLEVNVAGPDSDIDTIEDLRRHWGWIRSCLDAEIARRLEGTAFSSSPA